MGKIVVVGSLNMDIVSYVDRMPRIGETLQGNGFGLFPGGKGANQAYAAARLGADVQMLGCVGHDSFGLQLIDSLSRVGVDCSHIQQRKEHSTGTAVIVVCGGDNFIILDAGANAAATKEFISAHRELITSADIVMTQMETPYDGLHFLVDLCHDTATPLLLDPAPAAEIPLSLLQRIHCLTPNETEAELLTGISCSDDAGAYHAVCYLRDMGIPIVCLTRGEKGVLYTGSGASVQERPSFKVDVVDSTAAGDTFAAALAYALSESWDIDRGIELAQRAAALSTTKKGAQTSIPSFADIESFFPDARDGR